MMYGTNLLSAADKLQTIELSEIYKMITHPSDEFQIQIERLRTVKSIDGKQYALLKRSLPYFVCGQFNPAFRRIQNFSVISWFVLDIDHCREKGLDLSLLRLKLQNDNRVCMSFLSPGQDGLKIVFHLKSPCYDASLFSLFYKEFAQRFSDLYGLEQVIDMRTSDVSRACFISSDSAAFYREQPEAVDTNEYILQDDVQFLLDLKNSQEHLNTKLPTTNKKEDVSEKEPDLQTLQHIREVLNMKKLPQTYRPVPVPAILNNVISGIVHDIEDKGIQVDAVSNIQYGKKIRIKLGILMGEINLFYGKKGFSVVKSPKRGSSAELNDAAAEIIEYSLTQNNFS